MDTCVELVLIEHLLQTFAVADVYLVEGYFLADDLGYALQCGESGVPIESMGVPCPFSCALLPSGFSLVISFYNKPVI